MNNIYKELKVTPIHQFQKINTEKGVYFGIWSFGDIVHSIKFTHREPLNFDIFKENNEIKKKHPEFDSDYYQRLINDERTKRVIQFIVKEMKAVNDEQKSTLITFPTSLILSLYLSDANTLEEYDEELIELDESNFFQGNIGVYFNSQSNTIHLPKKNVMLVVDGQHRLAGLYATYQSILNLIDDKELIEGPFNRKLIDYAQKSIEKLDLGKDGLLGLQKIVEAFQFSCTVLLDFDIWEQGKVFADVNFNQKPVNKSLYYDIFGSYPDPDKNDIYLAHKWTVLLNSSQDSPLYKKIKLLGTGDGFFSQAFFVEALLPLLRKNGIWNKVVTDFIISETPNELIPKFLKAYFTAVVELYRIYAPDEQTKPSAYKNVLFKTTGLGALIKLIPFVYKNIEESLNEDVEVLKDRIKEIFVIELQKEKVQDRLDIYITKLRGKLKEFEAEENDKEVQRTTEKIDLLEKEKNIIDRKMSGEYYFSTSGNFSKSAGKGLQDKLFKELAFDLGFIQAK